jgi:hypothetical protein
MIDSQSNLSDSPHRSMTWKRYREKAKSPPLESLRGIGVKG